MTASKPKTPSPSGISRLLAAAGFERSVSEGRNGYCSGFEVHKDYSRDGAVRVGHHFAMMSSNLDRTRRKAELAKYAEAITGAGWSVDTREYELIVTAKTED